MKTLMRNGRDRRSENPLLGHAKKERVVLIGTDQRITSGPAAKRLHLQAEYMTAPDRFADSQIPLAPRAPSIHDPLRSAPGSWQRIGGESPPRGRFSQPPRPRVMHEVLLARAAVKRSQGETTGQVLSCETGLIPRCRSRSVEEKATSSHGERLAWEEPRAVEDLVHGE